MDLNILGTDIMFPKIEENAAFAGGVFDDPFDAFHPALSDSNNTHINFSTCLLFTLPRELRNIIYADLVKFGDLNLTRVSKQFALEFTEIIWKRGICRFTADEMRPEMLNPILRLRKPLADAIQYLDLRIRIATCCLHEQYHVRDPRVLRKFNDSRVPRKSCHVLIEIQISCPDILMNPLGSTHRLPLKSLGGFEILTIEVCSKVEPILQPLYREHSESIAHFQDSMYEMCDRSLRQSLGTCIRRNENKKETRYLEFRPRAHLEAQAQRRKMEVQEASADSTDWIAKG